MCVYMYIRIHIHILERERDVFAPETPDTGVGEIRSVSIISTFELSI